MAIDLSGVVPVPVRTIGLHEIPKDFVFVEPFGFDATAEMIARGLWEYRSVAFGDFGSLHIAMADGNIEDSHLLSCLEYARESRDREGHALGLLLLSLPIEARGVLYLAMGRHPHEFERGVRGVVAAALASTARQIGIYRRAVLIDHGHDRWWEWEPTSGEHGE